MPSLNDAPMPTANEVQGYRPDTSSPSEVVRTKADVKAQFTATTIPDAAGTDLGRPLTPAEQQGFRSLYRGSTLGTLRERPLLRR